MVEFIYFLSLNPQIWNLPPESFPLSGGLAQRGDKKISDHFARGLDK